MNGLDLLAILVILLVSGGVFSKMVKKYNEAMHLEDVLGKDAYYWLLKSKPPETTIQNTIGRYFKYWYVVSRRRLRKKTSNVIKDAGAHE